MARAHVPDSSALPRLPTAARGLISGCIVTFIACLFAAELLLGLGADGHVVRACLLGVAFVASIALAGALHPEERLDLSVGPSPEDAGHSPFSPSGGAAGPVTGGVLVQ